MGENFEYQIDDISSIAEQTKAILSLEGFQVQEIGLQKEISQVVERLNTLYLDSDSCVEWIESATSYEEQELAWECLDLTQRSITTLWENKCDIEDFACKFYLRRTLNYKIEKEELDYTVMKPLEQLESWLLNPSGLHYSLKHIIERCEHGFIQHSFLIVASKFVEIPLET